MAHTSRTLVGRDAELAEITALLGVRPTGEGRDGATDGPPASATVLLSGDAGVGKTRLLTELRDVAFTEGWQVFAGHCLDFGDSALPYLPFSEVLGRMAVDLPEVVDAVAALHPALARLQPGRRVMSAGEDRDAAALDRTDLFEAVHALLTAAAEAAPLLLVIEDAHWADQSTRDMLSFLFSRPAPGRVAVVASYRSDDLHRRHPLRGQVAEWSRIRGVERLQLAPLTPPDVRALIAALEADGLPEEQVAGIVDRAEGNAFFVEELVGAASGPDRWVPADLADVLLVRLDRLDDTARQVVRAASVAGRQVSHEVLVAASALDDAALDAGLRAAVETNVLVAGAGTYAFRHALLGEAVYDDLLPGERVRLHAAYADALREGRARGTAAELARHARLAMDLDTALDASIRAGTEAAAVGGPDEAAQHFQQALELLADPRRRATTELDLSRLVVSTADALVASGHPDRAAAVVREQLDRLPDDAPPAWWARMLAARATALAVIETEEDPAAISAEALALVPEGAADLRARVLGVHARTLAATGRWEEAQAVGLDALELAERLDLSELASDALTTLSGLKKSGPKEALRTALTEAVARAEAAGALHAELRGRFLLGRSYEDWAELEEAEAWFRSGIERGARAGVPWAPYAFEARWQLTWVLITRGEWDAALALADVRRLAPPPIVRATLDALRLSVEQARGHDVGDDLAALRRFWPREGGIAIHAAGVAMRRAGSSGDPAGALAAYDDAVAVLTRIWHPWFSARIRLAATALEAVVPCLAGMSAAERVTFLDHAERLHADGRTVLERYADPSGFWGPEGRAWRHRLDAQLLRVRWLVGVDAPPLEELVGSWRQDVALFEAFGDVHEVARSQAALAGILRASGDLAGARAAGDAARTTAHRLGAQPLLDELRALGSAPVRADGPPDALTARETEILGLVAQGRSNGEIAKLLFISAKTVSVHVSNILGKLGAAGRTEAAAIGRRKGLVP